MMSKDNYLPHLLHLLGLRLLTEDEALIKFLAEVANEKITFKDHLMDLIFKSRNIEKNDNDIIYAAANSITILVAANISFAHMDLSKVRICGANIRDGCFNGANFTETDLTGVLLENCKLNHCFFNKTNMKDVKLGILPDINLYEDNAQLTFDYEGVSMCCSQKDNGKEVLTGLNDCSAKLWDRSNGKLIKTFEGPKAVSCIDVSKDGNFIVSGSSDYSFLILWEAKTGNMIKSFDGHKSGVKLVFFTPDETMILSSSSDRSIKLWDITNGKLINSFHDDSRGISMEFLLMENLFYQAICIVCIC